MPDPMVVAGVGVLNANSYVSLAEANAYFIGKRLHSAAWTTAIDDTKMIALQQASLLLDLEFRWSGVGPVLTGQGLDWPRLAATDRYGHLIVGVPAAVKFATCEVAYYLLASDRLAPTQGAGLKSVKVDVIEIEFDKSAAPETLPPHVGRMLSGVGSQIRVNGRVGTVRLTRV